ncbi:MAG: DUF4760 domain-containing protein [Candidatus Sulfotelmatobacter sp.]
MHWVVNVLGVLKEYGSLITAFSVFVAIWTLKANHDWNRRNYTAGLIGEWNDETSIHRKAIEKLRSGLIDLDTRGDVIEISEKDARAIYASKVDTPDWELRFHFIELLNYFEVIAAAYRNRVGDPQMIEESLRNVLVRWRKILRHFMEVVEKERGYKPWEPFTTVVDFWDSKPFKPRPFTGQLGVIWRLKRLVGAG